jgi:replicative DNA helicase
MLAVVNERPVANVEAELAVIAAMLCEPKIVDQLADNLRAEHFADLFLGFVYGTILREHSLGRTLSTVTLRPFLEREPAFAEIGGWPWLVQLGTARFTPLAAVSSARQITDLFHRRLLMDGLRETLIAAADYEQPVEKLIEQADEAISQARESERGRGEYSGADCISTVIDGFDAPLSGVTCGVILSIDQLLGPLRPKHLIIGAGRPGMGKTATAISYSLGAAQKGHGTLFLSQEMGAEDLGERMAADLCLEQRIPHDAIRDRKLTPDQKMQVCRARDQLAKLPLQIIDRSGVSPAQLRVMVRRWQRRFAARGMKLELVIVDYLQLMRAPGTKDRVSAVSEISQGLKEIAKEFAVTVFALCQLSRKVEERADKRPILADLRDSGQIEQDADAVLFFLRQEYYLRSADPPSDPDKRASFDKALQDATGRIEFICAKRRNGVTGSLKGEFLYHYQAVRG